LNIWLLLVAVRVGEETAVAVAAREALERQADFLSLRQQITRSQSVAVVRALLGQTHSLEMMALIRFFLQSLQLAVAEEVTAFLGR
jgi:hypothetical protein